MISPVAGLLRLAFREGTFILERGHDDKYGVHTKLIQKEGAENIGTTWEAPQSMVHQSY